ncbi:MAG: glutathione S-transferase family protein [Litorimonas sp.]
MTDVKMKLYCHPISPYARKVMILARLKNIKLEEMAPVADGNNGYTEGHNPLGKIPALEWQPEQYLFDSPVICQYLDDLSDEPILPTQTHERFIALWQHALGDGLSTAVYNYRYETVRPAQLHWTTMIERHTQAIINALDTLETISDWLGAPWTYGNLAIICALDYTSYRAPHINWKLRVPKLAKWHAKFINDAHYQDTYSYPEVSQ